MQVRSLSQEDALEKGMATNFSILAQRIPWTEKPGRLRPQGHKESDTIEATQKACNSQPEIKLKFQRDYCTWLFF